ncbi:MAG: WecB/TagA/CpsF family glycosyltransferase [Ardenticatenales bacterium]|nr:WecB/TagA/CpsF family glycosyltransferase [Ardenticatenales bacterium]
MHIAIDASRATRPHPTGTENYARQMIEQLVRVERGVRWTLFFRDEPGEWLASLPHVERIVLPRDRLWTYTALAPALLGLRPDVFWEPAHVLPPTVPLAGIPSLVTVHDLGYEHFPEAHTLAQRLYLRLTTRYHARAATHIAADSEATRRDLIEFYGATPEKISVVPLGVDQARFCPVMDAARLAEVRAHYATGERFLLYVGTLQPRKNVHRLVRAFAPIAAEFPEIRLVLAGGQGWLADDLQATIDMLGITAQVARPGYVADEDLPALLSAAEALLLPSLFEGFGLPVLEAMACGTPVLTSATSSLPEVAGNTALLVNPMSETQITDAMRLLLTQPALRLALRERGLARAATFTWERSAAAIFELLRELNGKAKGKRQKAKGKSNGGSEIDSIVILNLPIHSLTWEETMKQIAQMIEQGEPHQLVTVNPEFLMRATQESDFMDVLRRADLVLPDGVGLLMAARWQGQCFADRITGSDLTPRLADEAAERGWRLYLLGAAPGVAEKAAQRLRALHPTLEIIADGSDPALNGPPELIARIREAAPELLLVAYGAPKQDIWIDQFGRQTEVPVQIGIGGSLDFIAGVVPRAPVAWQRVGLEWLWRLKEEPWRWRRMTALPRFVLAAGWEALAKR